MPNDPAINVVVSGQDELSPVLNKAGQEVSSFGESLGHLSDLVDVALIAELVDHLVEIGAQALETGAHMAQMAQQTGLSVEQLSALQHAATTTGASNEQLEAGLRKFASTLSLAAGGSKAQADALAAMGIRLRDANGQMVPLSQQLVNVAQRFQQMPDGINKTSLAIQLFGRQGSALIPAQGQIAQGFQEMEKQAEQFGAMLSTEDADSLEQAQRSFDVLGESVKGLLQQFIVGMAPALQAIAQALTVDLGDGFSVAKTAGEFFGDSLRIIVDLLMNVFSAMEWAGDKIGLFGLALARLATGDVQGAADAIKELVGITNDAVAQMIEDKQSKIDQILAGGESAFPKSQSGDSDVTRRNSQAEALAKAKLKLEEENEKLAAEFSKSIDDLRLKETKDFYDKQLITAQQYYDRTQKLKIDQLQAELAADNAMAAALAQAIKTAPDEKTRVELQTQYAAATEKATVAQSQLNALQGKGTTDANSGLAAQAQAMDRNAFLAEDMGKRIEQVYAQLTTDENQIAFLIKTHQIDQLTAESELNQKRDEAHQKLTTMTADYQQFAAASGDPKLIQNAQNLNLKLQELTFTTNSLRDAALDAWQHGLGTFLTDIETHSKSAGQAFLDLIKGMMSAVDDLIAKVIALWIWQKIAGIAAGAAAPAGVTVGSDAGTMIPPLGGGGGISAGAAPAFTPPSLPSSAFAVPAAIGVASFAGAPAGGATPTVIYQIDARGSAPGVEQLIMGALKQVTPQIVAKSKAAVLDYYQRR